MPIENETWQEQSVRLRDYREKLPILFPELFEEQYDYRLKITDNNGDANKHIFELINGCHEDDIPSFKYEIDFTKNKYSLIFNFNCYVSAASYNELVLKRKQVLEGTVEFIRLPEFQSKVWLGGFGTDFWANGSRGFCSGAHTPEKDFNSCAMFAARYLYDAYCSYSYPRGYTYGYLEHEKRVERSQLKTELSKLKKRKRDRAMKERDESPVFEIFVEETLDYILSFKYSWPGTNGGVCLPRDASKEEIEAVFKDIFQQYFGRE